MAEPIAGVTPGAQSTEWLSHQHMQQVGTILLSVAAIFAALPDSLQGNKWVALGAGVLGTVIKVFAGLGYINARADVKSAALAAQGFADPPAA